MKILCSKSPDLSHSTMSGWANVLKKAGFDFIFWDSKIKPVFDAFDEYEPDIFISTVNDISRGLAQCLSEFTETKSIFYSPSYERVTDENKQYMEQLKTETGKPDLIFTFAHQSQLANTLDGWKGYQTASIMKAGDNTVFKRGPVFDNWKSDIAFIGSNQPYLNKYILPICHSSFKSQLSRKSTVRIYGNNWPIPQAVGMPIADNIPKIFSSANITLDISDNDEPSDIPFNVILSGGFCLTNSFKYMDIDIPKFTDESSMLESLKYHLSKSTDYDKTDILAYVLMEHTYWNRMLSLLKTLQFYDEYEQLEQAYNEVN